MAWYIPSLLRSIRVIQNNTIQVFCGIGSREPMRLVYSEINIMPAAGLHDFILWFFIYKKHNEDLPDCFAGIFCERSDAHQHHTWMQGNIEVSRLASSRSSFSLVYRASKLGTNWVRILRIKVILTSLDLIYIWSCSVGILSKQINYIFSGWFSVFFNVLFWSFIM